MSLVVAMINDGRIHVCADIRVVKPVNRSEHTEPHSPHYFNGVMKIIPVSKSVAIAYAGTVSIALEAIREIQRLNLPSEEIAEKILEHLTKNRDINECDFLIINMKEMTIHRLKNGSTEIINEGRTWIGDINAYNLYQEKLQENGYDTAPNPIAKSSAMMNSLEAVIEDGSIENVGEFPTSIFNSNGEIQQMVAFKAFGTSGSFGGDMTDDSMIINLTVPVDSSVAASGFYLNKFKKGALYLPLVQDEPFLIDGETIGEFRTKVLNEFGIELLGGGFE